MSKLYKILVDMHRYNTEMFDISENNLDVWTKHKEAIEKLITEARIQEVTRIEELYCNDENILHDYLKMRSANLKKELRKKVNEL